MSADAPPLPPVEARLHILVAEIRRCIEDDMIVAAYRKLAALDALLAALPPAQTSQDDILGLCHACGKPWSKDDARYGPDVVCMGCLTHLFAKDKVFCHQCHAAHVDRKAALPPAQTWQPIETAPRDFSWFLAYNSADRDWGVFRMPPGGLEPDDWQPTHWMPLPAPPTSPHGGPAPQEPTQ